MSNFKTKFCWWPVRLARRVKPTDYNGPTLEMIGWVWMQRASLVKNINHGWIAILDTKPEPEKCKKCGQLLPPNVKLTGLPLTEGYKELKQFNKFEGGRMVCYGYSITYDRGGEEISRTEPSAISSIGWDNSGTPFTEADYKTLSA